MRSMVVGLLVVALAQPVGGQKTSKLDDRIDGELRVDAWFLSPCKMGLAIDQIARGADVLVGFQNTRDCWLNPRSPAGPNTGAVLMGVSAREAFDKLVELMPDYRWKEIDGVVVVRPNAAWDDPRDPLNFVTGPFDVKNVHVNDVLEVMLHAVVEPLVAPHLTVVNPNRPIDNLVSVTFPGGTMLDALNAVIRARGRAEWQVGYTGNGATVAVSTLEFGGGTVTAPFWRQ